MLCQVILQFITVSTRVVNTKSLQLIWSQQVICGPRLKVFASVILNIPQHSSPPGSSSTHPSPRHHFSCRHVAGVLSLLYLGTSGEGLNPGQGGQCITWSASVSPVQHLFMFPPDELICCPARRSAIWKAACFCSSNASHVLPNPRWRGRKHRCAVFLSSLCLGFLWRFSVSIYSSSCSVISPGRKCFATPGNACFHCECETLCTPTPPPPPGCL